MKKVTIAIVLLASVSNIFGQSNGSNHSQYDPGVRNVPTSPEVALLGRFGDIPVGHYTGTAEVSVPLYTLKVDNIEIPLALSYHTSGIKVADEATWVGLGWNFMPEGTITQEIRGREEFVSGGDGFSNNGGYNVFKSHFATLYAQSQISRLQVGFNGYNSGSMVITNPAVDDSDSIINDLNGGKGQPDIFTYSFYGYSGKFFINPENSSEILFMESNDDVKFSRNSSGWVATTNKGDKFYFNTIESSRSAGVGTSVDIAYTFKISKIILVSGKVINFYYQDETSYSQYPVQVTHLTDFDWPAFIKQDDNITINEKKTLTSIETEDTQINFNLDNREDIRPTSPSVPIKKLASIDIKSKYPNKKIKSFVLNTSYFNPVVSTPEEGYKNKRLKLNSIQEIGYNEAGTPIQSSPPYTFEYDMNKTMPNKWSSSDFFGYNNGTNSSTLIPDLLFFDYLNKTPYKNYGMTVNYPANTVSRYTNTNYITTNILEKVTYPTGARTEFEYESNTFSNQFIPTPEQAWAANKDVSLTHRGASITPGGYYFIQSPAFKLPEGKNIKFYNTIYDGYMGPTYPEVHYEPYGMWDCKIQFFKRKIINGQSVTTLVKQWSIDVSGPTFEQTHQRIWDEELTVSYDSDPSTEYYVRVENPLQYRSNDGMHRAVVSSRFRYYDDTDIDKSISYGSGVRIKSIKNYENSTLLSHKAYTYSGGKLIYPFQPLNLISGATHKSQPSFITGGCLTESISLFNDISVNSNDFGISGNKTFGYDEVTEKDINVLDGTIKGLTKYYFTNNPFINSLIKGVPKIDIPSNGENVLIEKYDSNQNKLYSKANMYDNLPNTYGVYPSFSIINSSTGVYDPSRNYYPFSVSGCGINGTAYTGASAISPDATSKYRFIFNPLITGKRRLTKTIETTYLNGKSMVETTDLSYTPKGELDISTVKSADGKITQTDYDYAYDVDNMRLVNKGMTGVPLSIEVSQGEVIANTPLSHIETKYDTPGNYLPSSMKSGYFVSYMDTEVTYDKYDGKGNLLQYTRKEGIPVALIWGYGNTQVIAKVEGATYDQAMALAGSADIITKSNQDVDTATQNLLISQLDLFRTDNSRQVITTYTYDPLIGVTSITPPSGVREVYVYDSSNRLKQVVDVDGKALKEYSYHYKN
ncbi:hypothetical protein [Chryseobacterium hagamense]|uniref:YD repeat-containing protein n=1 Tax=Chryseobacterium hagamense TaxID=395935 RepID=A0A511YQP1_9FLAO|nr:hypothetical protein [Chryseobacterium hagamense]GEN77505.1 hypothetical protein CHA01nite_32450 [Chryseobacterium hagamense]